MKIGIKRIAILSILAALSILLVYVIRIPMFASYLEYDPADIPILIATFCFGMYPGLFLTLVVSVLQGITVSASSGIVGIIMHLFSTGTFVLVAGYVSKKSNNKYRTLVSLILGIISTTIVMCALNLILTPIFLGSPINEVAKLIFPIIVPFNLVKLSINSFLIFFLYKMLGKHIAKYNS